jgi:predicted transcriptional regulator
MTLSFLQTARYSAKPRLAHINTTAKPQPVYTSLDELIAAMQKDAKEINKRREKERPTSVHAKGRLAEHAVYDYVKDNPGASVHEVADHFERNIKSIASLLSRMEERNSLKSEMGRNPETKRPVRCFTIVQTRNVKRDHRTQAQHVYDFIKANPGSNKAAMAHGTGLTVKQIEGALTNMGRYKDRFPIRREYENGKRSTVRVWAI